jgi:hypothetical protein
MSKATKRKHVTREVLDEFVTPEEKQIIVKVKGVHFYHFIKIVHILIKLLFNLLFKLFSTNNPKCP